MLHQIVWRNDLSYDQQEAYKDMFFKLQTQFVSADPTLLAVLRRETDRELTVAFEDQSAIFVTAEVGERLVACITVYKRPKYLSIRHFAAVAFDGPVGIYTVRSLCKKLLVNIQLEYPVTPFYGIAPKTDQESIDFYQSLLGAQIGIYFIQEEHPEKTPQDGWVGVSVGKIESSF